MSKILLFILYVMDSASFTPFEPLQLYSEAYYSE